ncbi:hypothetical protein SAMN05661044_03726 [Olivibacter domesticus]|uniref:HD domain-containing protein n=2 Tax=Olivibacter domesticus TaxID=407022 RepID=A0A1H7U4J9_OLID1|nr:hypothetical protein SAMN05661044_03726 [Olivibacter domesticus]
MQLEQVTTFILDQLKHDLSPAFTYHQVDHTQDVIRAVRDIGLGEGISGNESIILSTAALFHDTGFLIAAENHEMHSCEIARKHLPHYSYTEGDIDQVCSLIMATKVPQKPKNRLEEIICDADLDYVGREDFFEISEKLYEEMVALGSVSSREHYMQLQLDFIRNHHYFTKTARTARNKIKEENLTKIKTNSEA